MDTQAGAQFATNSHQTTIDLQTGIIAAHQDEIGRANVKLADQSAEIDRLNLVLADRQAKIAQLMGEVARAGMAAPAAPSEQAEPLIFHGPYTDSLKWTDKVIRIADKSDMSLPELAEQLQAAAEMGAPYVLSAASCAKLFDAMTTPAAAPAAPLPDQPEQIQPQQSGSIRPSAEPAGQHDAQFVGTLNAIEVIRATPKGYLLTVKLEAASLPDHLLTIGARATIGAAPVSGMPDLASLQRFQAQIESPLYNAYAEMVANVCGDYVLLADVERLLKPTGETK